MASVEWRGRHPTGSVDAAMAGMRIEYPMQIGSGTFSMRYRLGNRYQLGGSDPMLDPTDEPTKNPNLQGGKRLSALLGLTVHPQSGILTGQHFHLQVDVPVVQSLDGPQLQRRWVVRLGWQMEFGS